MRLGEVLDINENRIRHADLQGWAVICGNWQAAGSPTDPEALEKFLDAQLRILRDGLAMRWPGVVLLRVKQLQRRQFEPRRPAEAESAEAEEGEATQGRREREKLAAIWRRQGFKVSDAYLEGRESARLGVRGPEGDTKSVQNLDCRGWQ